MDRKAGVLHDVRVLGRRSMNGREYTVEAIAKAKGLYEGRAVNADHPLDPTGDRSIQDRMGWLQNVRDDSTGLTADLHLLRSHPMSERIFEAAERRPQLFGLSHNAEGRTHEQEGRMIVDEITDVRSVDVVADPATTRSLFESLHWEPAMKKKLKEQDEMPAEMPAETPADSGGGPDPHEAFKAMIMGVLDDSSLDVQGKKTKIGEILKAEEKLTASDAATTAEQDGEEPPKEDEEEKPVESLKQRVGSLTEKVKRLEKRLAALDKEEPTSGTVVSLGERRERITVEDFVHAIT
ncbi:MAG: hypothetical protein IMZ55_05170 [Acidobacteria bacterium]|nr:hypothetical protein [Acidobacteriota bacterium]